MAKTAKKSKAKKLTVKKSEVVKLLVALKLPTATDWSSNKIAEKLGKIDKLAKGVKVKDKKLNALLSSILTAIGADQNIVLEDDSEEDDKPAKGKVKNAKGGKKGNGGKTEDADEDEDEDEDEEDEDSDDDEDEEDEDSDDDEDEEDEDSDDDDDESDEEEDDEEDEDSEEDEDEDDDEDEEEDEDSEDEEDESDEDEDEDEDSDDDDESDDDEEDDDVEDSKTSKKGKKGKNGKGDTKPDKGKGDKKKGGGGKAKSDGQRPGVILKMVELLANATADKPLAKKKLHAKLVKLFPDKRPDALLSTMNTYVPNKLRVDKGLAIEKNANGFFINVKKSKAKLKEMGVKLGGE